MREIKFRAWDEDEKEMVYDPETNVSASMNISTVFLGSTLLWMQFTGLRDKNGKEIFEGDIITCEGGYETPEGGSGECEEPRIVEWEGEDGLKYIVRCPRCDDACSLGEYDVNEVIGNIYENPELLK